MKKIELIHGEFALVDDSDFDYLNQFNWYVFKSNNTSYAVRTIYTDGKSKSRRMHRDILGNDLNRPNIDHKNGDGLDNQRLNLRFCNQSENNMNKRARVGCSSIYKGVYWKKQVSKFASTIKINGKSKHLGFFSDEVMAAVAYDAEALKLFGEFAKPNFKIVV